MNISQLWTSKKFSNIWKTRKQRLRLLFSERVKKYPYGPLTTLKVIFTNSPQIIVHLYFKTIIILFRQIYIILFPQSINMLFKVVSSSHKILLTLRTDLILKKSLMQLCFVRLSFTRIESWDMQDPHRKWPLQQLKILPFFGNLSRQTFS